MQINVSVLQIWAIKCSGPALFQYVKNWAVAFCLIAPLYVTKFMKIDLTDVLRTKRR